MLRKLSLSGFKAYETGEVHLRPFTVLIGPNGAGKTTIMEAIDVLGRLVTGTIKELLDVKGWEYGDLPHLRAATSEFSVTADFVFNDGVELEWELGLGDGSLRFEPQHRVHHADAHQLVVERDR